MEKMVDAKTYGKIIIMGEHSVIYNHHALVLPFNQAYINVSVTATNKASFLVMPNYQGLLQSAPDYFTGYKHLIKQVLSDLKQSDFSLWLEIDVTLPFMKGFGYSASLATALVRAIYNYFQQDLTTKLLYQYVSECESYYHENPSGLDMVAISQNIPLAFRKDLDITPLNLNTDGYLIVVDSQEAGSTKEAVNLVSLQFINNYNKTFKLIETLGDLTLVAINALSENDLKALGLAMNQAQVILDTLGLSTKNINHIIKIMQQHACLGAKLSGSGLGGCVIGLVKDLTTAKNIQKDLTKVGFNTFWLINLAEFNNEK